MRVGVPSVSRSRGALVLEASGPCTRAGTAPSPYGFSCSLDLFEIEYKVLMRTLDLKEVPIYLPLGQRFRLFFFFFGGGGLRFKAACAHNMGGLNNF